MENVLRGRTLSADSWRKLDDGEPLTSDGDVLVPLARWQSVPGDLPDRPGRIGLWLEADDGPGTVAANLDGVALIAVHFPRFTDGRGYSIARLLRERFGYRGELRAVGDVQRDQLFYLMRCGFDSFALNPREDAAAATAAFDDFSEAYQASVERPAPLFLRRRNEAGGVA